MSQFIARITFIAFAGHMTQWDEVQRNNFFMLLRDYFLEQVVLQHKRREAVIDLVKSNAQQPIQEVTGAEPLNDSAHGVISCSIRRAVTAPRNDTVLKRRYKNEKIRRRISGAESEEVKHQVQLGSRQKIACLLTVLQLTARRKQQRLAKQKPFRNQKPNTSEIIE